MADWNALSVLVAAVQIVFGAFVGFLLMPMGFLYLDGFTWVMGAVVAIFLSNVTGHDFPKYWKENIFIPVGIVTGTFLGLLRYHLTLLVGLAFLNHL